jgi:hypothetical protein
MRDAARARAITVDGLQRRVQLSQFHGGIAPLGIRDGRHDPAQFGIAVEHEFDGGAPARRDFLLDVGNLQCGGAVDFAAIGGEVTAQRGKQTGFPGPVGAGETDLVAAKDGEVDLLEQRLRTAPQGEIPSR